jgi:hypothetical protein
MNDTHDIRVVLRQKGFLRMPDGSYSKTDSVVARPSHPVVERDAGRALVGAPPDEAGGPPRVVLRITRHACRVLDADNFAGGAKYLIDTMRHERLIPNDDPASIRLAFEQVRVRTHAEEGTMIEVMRPENGSENAWIGR